MSKLPYLNLGCGKAFHKSWKNLDFVSSDPAVEAHDLLKGIPYSDNSFMVVYHSHVLEHFPKDQAPAFMAECYRVLKPGGIIRVAVPDLEQIARNYLRYLEESLQGSPLAREKYDWTMLELYDQVVRTRSGGEMLQYMKDADRNNDAFLLERNGEEVAPLLRLFREKKEAEATSNAARSSGFRTKLKEKLLKRWLGEDYAQLLETGRFRASGEIHQWMYDRFSLCRLLSETGFRNPRVTGPFESAIKEWNSFGLDGKDEVVRKPDSLFMEAEK